jgi:hypothetical protein
MDFANSGPKSRCSTKDQDWKQQVETKETACFSERKWIEIRKMVGTQYLLTQLSRDNLEPWLDAGDSRLGSRY